MHRDTWAGDTCIVSRPKYRDTKIFIFIFFIFVSVTHGFHLCFALFVAHTQHELCCASFIVPFKGTFGKGVMMHRCIAILGPAIRVSYRDPSIAILKKKTFFFFFFKVTHGF